MLKNLNRRLNRHFATRSRGQGLVEFALILPVFMLFFATTLDLGRLAMSQLSVANAAHEGAFQASKTPTSFNNALPCPADASSNLVVCRVQLEAKSSGVTIAPSDIALSCSVSGCPVGLGNLVTVTVTGHFQLLTPILAGFFNGSQSVTFTKSATSQIETLPPVATATPTATPGPTATATPTPTATATPTPTATATPAPTVCTLPSAGFTYTPDPATGSGPLTVSVTDTTTSPSCAIQSWFWDFGDLYTYSGQNAGSHTYTAKGTYKLTLTVTNSAGSNTSGKVQVVVR